MLGRASILARLAILAAVLLAILVASNAYLAQRLSRNADAIALGAAKVSELRMANSAVTHFGEFKYWLSDLAVSLAKLRQSNLRPATWPVNDRMSLLLWEAAFASWQVA